MPGSAQIGVKECVVKAESGETRLLQPLQQLGSVMIMERNIHGKT